MTKLLVANGGENLKSVEIINLDADSPNLICDNLPDFPLGLRGTTGHLYAGSKPIICGGFDFNSQESCKCYEYLDGNWVSVASLKDCRRFSVSVLFTKDNNEDILFIAGGAYDTTAIDTVESFDGSEWDQETFADMPNTLWLHCMVKINDSFLFIAGGLEGYSNVQRKTYFFNVDENLWSSGNPCD
jgi:hypothetical protein